MGLNPELFQKLDPFIIAQINSYQAWFANFIIDSKSTTDSGYNKIILNPQIDSRLKTMSHQNHFNPSVQNHF